MQGAQEGGPVGTLTADPCYIAETNIVKHPPIKNKFKKRNETNLFRKQRLTDLENKLLVMGEKERMGRKHS